MFRHVSASRQCSLCMQRVVLFPEHIACDVLDTICRRDVKVDVTDWQETEQWRLKASWRFRCILDLPWKPVLAAAGAHLAHIWQLSLLHFTIKERFSTPMLRMQQRRHVAARVQTDQYVFGAICCLHLKEAHLVQVPLRLQEPQHMSQTLQQA